MMRRLCMMDQMLLAAQNIGDEMLRWQFQKEMMKQQFFSKEEYDQLVEDITWKVLANISITVDAEEIIDKIEELNQKLNQLGK